MKTQTLVLTISLALTGAGTANAQLFQPTQVRDAALGAVAGALVGGHNHDRWAEGAALGAATGLVVGSTIDRPAARIDAPTAGAVLGAVAGAAIGNHNGRNGAVGAVIGAVAGYGLGSAVQPPPQARAVTYDDDYPAAAIEDARTVPNAPMVGEESLPSVYVERPAPVRVVRVIESPRVVYLPALGYCAPCTVIVSRPSYGRGYGWRDRADCGPVYVTPSRHWRR